MIEITDEMVQSLETALEQSRRYDGEGGYFTDDSGFIAALTAVAPLIEAQVREQMQKHIDGAYEERNRLVALLAAVFPSGQKPTAIEGWDADWHPCVYIDLPCGQASWHYHISQAAMFEHVGDYLGELDGHSTEEKYRRIAEYAANLSPALREQMAEDRMAGEILRAMMADDDVITLQNAGIGVGFVVSAMDENRQIGCNHKGRYATIPALHAAMVEAGMIGKDDEK